MQTELVPRLDAGLTLDFHLLGIVPLPRALALQRRLVAEVATGVARSIPVLMCEHTESISVGRTGSRVHIRLSQDELRRRDVAVEWVQRGGGGIAHGPGQLCVYPILPLREIGWTVGEYLRRLRNGIVAAIERLNLTAESREECGGIWGRTGMLAAIGVAVHNWTTCHGAFLNVNPARALTGFVQTDGRAPMSSLLAERRGAVKMPTVRTAVIECLATAFAAETFNIHADSAFAHDHAATSKS